MQAKEIFSPESPYKKRAGTIALLWTLLIFIGCLLPGKDLPQVNVPFADKWVHFVLFGGFAFLWLCSRPSHRIVALVVMLVITILFGWFIEFLQLILKFLGRSYDLMDVLADGTGGLIGVTLFGVVAYAMRSRANTRKL